MPSVFLVSDTHFGHAGICKFTDRDGRPVRPWDDAEQMNKDMVEYWNDTVGPKDKVYHLGDVVINRRYLPIMDQLHGDKVLIKGNHDLFKLPDYLKYFRDIRAYWPMNGFILSHIPVHPNQFTRWKGNIHGHTHTNHVMRDCEFDTAIGMLPGEELDPRYMNVCVEQTNYRPILFEDVLKRYAERGIN